MTTHVCDSCGNIVLCNKPDNPADPFGTATYVQTSAGIRMNLTAGQWRRGIERLLEGSADISPVLPEQIESDL